MMVVERAGGDAVGNREVGKWGKGRGGRWWGRERSATKPKPKLNIQQSNGEREIGVEVEEMVPGAVATTLAVAVAIATITAYAVAIMVVRDTCLCPLSKLTKRQRINQHQQQGTKEVGGSRKRQRIKRGGGPCRWDAVAQRKVEAAT